MHADCCVHSCTSACITREPEKYSKKKYCPEKKYGICCDNVRQSQKLIQFLFMVVAGSETAVNSLFQRLVTGESFL
jgi:hypothetical protein